MKVSTIGASIVGFATGLGAILTVIEQWHNIEQWANPTPHAAATPAVVQIAPAAPVAAAIVPPGAPPLPSAVTGCFVGALGAAFAPIAQCGMMGPVFWGVNRLRVCLNGASAAERAAVTLEEDRTFLARNGMTVTQENTATQVNAVSAGGADLTITYSRGNLNAYNMPVPVLAQAHLNCHAAEGSLECAVQLLAMDFGGASCAVVAGEQQVSLERE